MDAQTKEKIKATQAANWSARREATEQLRALRETHRRALEALDLCAAYVEYRATEEGDPFARFLKQRVDAAFDAMNAEGIGGRTLTEQTTPQSQTGNSAAG